jgi:hypothetical protein
MSNICWTDETLEDARRALMDFFEQMRPSERENWCLMTIILTCPTSVVRFDC